MHALQNDDISVEDIFNKNEIEDTQLMLHTQDEEAVKNLESLTESIFGVKKMHYKDTLKTITKEDKLCCGIPTSQTASFPYVQIPIGGQYSAEDVFFMKKFYPILKEGLEKDRQVEHYKKNRINYLKALWRIERTGIKIDIEALEDMKEKAKVELDKLIYKLYSLVGAEFKPNSSQHLYEILFGFKKKTISLKPNIEVMLKDKASTMTKQQLASYKKSLMQDYANVQFTSSNTDLVKHSMGFKPIEFTTGGQYGYEELKTPQTSSDVLKKLKSAKSKKANAIPFLNTLLDYKKLSKIYSGFLEGMSDHLYKDGKVHPSLNICGTDSGRLSASNPNIAQLPAPLEKNGDNDTYYDFWSQFEIRKLFIASSEDKVLVVRTTLLWKEY